MTRESRDSYVKECKNFARKLFDERKLLVSYVRKQATRQPIGVITAWKTDDGIRVGWSKCNLKCDRFNRFIGIRKACETEPEDLPDVPSMIPAIDAMVQRSQRYFNRGPQSSVAK